MSGSDILNQDEIDALLASAEDTTEVPTQNNPLFELMVAPGFQGGPILATFNVEDTAKVNDYLQNPQVRSLLTGEQRYAKFAWGKTDEDSEVASLYALKGPGMRQPTEPALLLYLTI